MSKVDFVFPDGVYVREGGPIPGVRVRPLRRLPDERGTIHHILSSADPDFVRFGEVYASTVVHQAVKGWHKHEEMTLNYACLHGRVKCVLLFETNGRTSIMEVFLGPDSPLLLTIPPRIWNGFKGLSAPDAIIVNVCTHAHDPGRTTRLPPDAFPYDWARKDH